MSLKEEDRRIIVEMELEKAEWTMRENADYNCSYDVSEEEILERIEPTRLLIEKIKKYIKNQMDSTSAI